MPAGDVVPTFYFKAKQLVPDLPPLVVGPDLPPGSADAEAKLDASGNAVISVRSDYPSPFLTPAQRAIEIENTLMHEAGHPYDKLLTSQGRNHHILYWAFRKFPGTWDQAQADADRMPQNGWQNQPRESWAECFGAAMSGRWTKPEKTMNWGKTVDVLAARAFFQSLAGLLTAEPTPPTPTKPEVINVNGKGCDIASYQGNVDFDLLKTEVAFVIAKSSEGTGYRDPTFQRNWSEAKRVGLTRGAYHFARPDLGTDAQDEAAYFLSSINPVDPGDLLALDYEVSWGGDVVGWCHSFLNLVRRMTGIAPLIYLNLSLVRGHDWTPVISDGYPLWLAAYDGQPEVVPATPWPSVAIKQWSSSGTLAGVTGRVDLNTAFGGEDMDRATFDQWFKEQYLTVIDPTIVAMKNAYDPLIVAARANNLLDAAQEAAITEAQARLDKLRTI